MSLTFYYSPMSTASITSLVLEELGVPCEKIKLDIKKGETRTPEFLRLNPNGKIPLVVHDGTSIWESAAITMYLGEVFGVGKNLYPAPGPKRGEAMKWITWANVTLGDAVGRWLRNTSEWTPAERATRAAQPHRLGTVHLEALELAVDDVNQAIQRFRRTVGLRFRPSLAGGGSRDADVGSQFVRLRPRRRGPGSAVIDLAAPVPAEQIVELLGCRWVVSPTR